MSRPLRVLIVDDAVVFRRGLTDMLSDVPYIEVVGTAANGKIALMKIPNLKPDALILDVEMPEMDGIATLQALRDQYPIIKVIMLSIHTLRGADKTLEALSLGAVDFVSKPEVDLAGTFHEYAEEIISKVRMAANANVKAISRSKASKAKPKFSADKVISKTAPRALKTTDQIIAVGASTGGTEAIKEFLMEVPADSPSPRGTTRVPK